MRMRFLLVHSFWLLVLASPTLADQLILHNGTVIEGTYVGGDARSVRFIGPDGNVQTYSVGDVSGIGFGTPPPTAAPPVYAAPPVPGFVQRQVAHSPTGVTVPAGTLITVRLIDSIDADLTGVGERFRASIDDPIVVGSQVVVPRYSDATVQVMRVEQSGALKGSDEVALKIYDITVNGRSYHLATDYAELQGKGKGGKTIRNTAIGGVGGAVIGGIFGGKKGAAIGAGAGAGTGIAVAAARGTKLKIPSETRLEFVLRAPLGLSYSVGDVPGTGFGTPPPTAAPPVYAASPVPGAVQRQVAHSPTGVTVPAGTLITVRLIDSIDADLTGVGERFRASIDDPIVVGSQVVVPRYSDATVQVMRVEQSGALKGSDEVALKIYDITVNGRSYHLATDYAELQGKGKGGKTIRNTAIGGVGGAVIGGIFGGKKGAAIGAGAGAGTGIAVAAARGTKLKIPSETRLEFVLRAPLGLSYSVGDVPGTGFGTPPPTAAPPVYAASPVPGAVQRQVAHSPTGVTVPAGTLITVRLIDSIDADLTGVGERFRASIDDPIVVGSQVVVPRYSDATVQVMRVEQSGALKGSDEVALKIYDITVNGRSYHLATDYAELQGKGKGGKTIRNTAIGGVGGAVIGGIFGGKKGAAIGAGAGAGTGVAVAAARGTKLKIPSETRLEFVLRAPLGL